ncbi:MAG: UDP-N-acetylmuramate--L-alanine ligase [Nitrospirae bacterium]|nr:UDP-N-acetylmuramate--L-alanine ligase [Nitrospirota bacterium]
MFRLVIAGGGTGGHLYPGIAVAREVEKSGGDVMFIGTDNGIEARVLPREGFSLTTIRAGKFKGMGMLDKMRTIAMMPSGVNDSAKALYSFDPDAVLGVGGYASFPAIVAARLLGRPVVIQEQNAYPGLTNRLLGRFADKVALGFGEGGRFFPGGSAVVTGNPIREELLTTDRDVSLKVFGLDEGRLTVLVFGGSAGAHRINTGVAASLTRLGQFRDRVQFIHQTGERDLEMVKVAYEAHGFKAAVMPFIYDMAAAYACADLAVCRSGALTLAEITALGKPAILVPYPHAANDHQVVNARALEKAGAAMVVLDHEATGETLSVFIVGLLNSPKSLADMAAKSRGLGRPDAAAKVFELCRQASEKRTASHAASAARQPIKAPESLMYKKFRHIHFVGIGGVGMSGIAEVLINLGYDVSGSDMKDSDTTRRLTELGAKVFIGHHGDNVDDAHVVVISSAVKADNPEVIAARERMIPVIPRAEMLAELMRLKYGIAVAGAHGKTTTTSLVSTILAAGGIDPTVVIGGRLNSMGSGAKLGQGEFLVAEADESDGSFLKLSPTIAVVTNIDEEHLDHYTGGIEQIKDAFLSFINKIPFYGVAVICLDVENIQDLIPKIEKRYITYGMSAQADFSARDITHSGMGSTFEVFHKGESLGVFRINIPGMHSVYNSLAAIAVGLELNISVATIRDSLREFGGVQRRFQVKGEADGVMVVDDYGHHPTEIRATLAAAKAGFDRRVVAVFQPHRYTRTRDMMKEFFTAFNQADRLVVTDIYAAGEKPIEGVTGKALFDGIRSRGHKDATFIPAIGDVPAWLAENLQQGDLLITLGAGDVWKAGEAYLREAGAGDVAG